jgi:acyl-CoA carboxylase subunit beta
VTLARVLSIGARRPVAQPAPQEAAAGGPAGIVISDPAELADRDPWETVKQARDLDRPTTLDYAGWLLDEFQELHGDRLSSDCAAIVGGLARLNDIPMVVIGHQKGHTAAELADRNFGMATPSGYRKAARLMRLAAKLGLPILTLVDTPGAYPGAEAEEQGQAVAIAENLRLMASLPVPVVSVVTGEGGSGGALALAVANQVLIWSNAIYSVISPEGCAAILWKEPSAAPVAAAALQLDARALLRLGIVDAVIKEPPGGAQRDHLLAAQRLRIAVLAAFGELLPMNPAQLTVKRHARFRRCGTQGAVAENMNGKPAEDPQ